MPKRTYFDKIDNPNGNLLFTVEQLNETTYADGKCLPVRCLNCGKIFYISRRDYIGYQFGSNTLQFCSHDCASKYSRNRVTKPCLLCGKLVTKSRGEAEKWPKFFCCKSHAATYNNKLRPPRSEESRQKTSKSVIKYRIEHKQSDHVTYYSGNHTTWNGKIIHYNSSYELDYCKVLDAQCVDYDIEALAV